MSKISLILPLLAGLALPSCITAQQQLQQQAMAADAKCQSFGAKPGTTEYIKCRNDLDRNSALQRQAIAQEEQAAYANIHNWYDR